MVSHELMGPWEHCILQCILICHGILGIPDPEMCTCGNWDLGDSSFGTLGTLDPEIYHCHGTFGTQDPEILPDVGPWEPWILKCYWTRDPGNPES